MTIQQPCPFCPQFLPADPELWNTIGDDFFGEEATINGVRSCGDCASIAPPQEEDKPQQTVKVVTLLDASLHFVDLQTKKCHVQQTTRMAPYDQQTLCGMPVPDDAVVREKRRIAASSICGRCTRVLAAYYAGKIKRAEIGEHPLELVAPEERIRE